jgi:tetratricopeptide (TPR) repeat protein
VATVRHRPVGGACRARRERPVTALVAGRSRGGLLPWALALGWLVSPARGLAQSPSALLAEGQAAYESLDYEAAAAALEAALAAPSASPIERAEALETLAFALAVLDREQEAADRLAELFALDPYRVVREPTGSPRIESLVERVRRREVPDAALRADLDVRLELPRRGRAGEAVTVRVRVGGAARAEVLSVRVRHRSETELDWHDTDAGISEASPRERDYDAVLTVPGGTERLEIYCEARDAQGRLLARGGGPLEPAYLEIASEPGRSAGDDVVGSWWLWTLVGVAVVGAGVGIGAGVAASEGGLSDGTLAPGRVVLP